MIRRGLGSNLNRGFALLAVLWVTVGMGTMALVGLLAARGAIAGARNRMALTHARWRAEDCEQRAMAVIEDVIDGRTALPHASGGWDDLDRVVQQSPVLTAAHCETQLKPTGLALDINTVNAGRLAALFTSLGIDDAHTDSLVATILDWRERDRTFRRFSAEPTWYTRKGDFPPRHGPFADVRELRRVRGLDSTVLADSVMEAVFTVEPGRILWARAPLKVLATLPGVGEEALARIADARLHGSAIVSVQQLEAGLSQTARLALDAHDQDLKDLTTSRPDAWILTSSGTAGAPLTTVSIELRLVMAGRHVVIVRRRSWP